MSRNPFDPTLDTLQASIPVFPLTGVLLLPRGKLPLNIFEPRYLNMVMDALASDRMIGMVQPRDPVAHGQSPDLSPVGCAGRITSFAETGDGRFLITLTGVCRFALGAELATTRGYRRVVADWAPFAADLEPDTGSPLDRTRMERALRPYFKLHGINVGWDAIRDAPDEPLVAMLSMICPFEPPEKQALLEAADLRNRADMLLALLEMAVHQTGGTGGPDQARH